jgi:hypothetical protein
MIGFVLVLIVNDLSYQFYVGLSYSGIGFFIAFTVTLLSILLLACIKTISVSFQAARIIELPDSECLGFITDQRKINWLGILFDSMLKYPGNLNLLLSIFIPTLTDASSCFVIASLTTPLIVPVWATQSKALSRKTIASHLILIHPAVHIFTNI